MATGKPVTINEIYALFPTQPSRLHKQELKKVTSTTRRYHGTKKSPVVDEDDVSRNEKTNNGDDHGNDDQYDEDDKYDKELR